MPPYFFHLQLELYPTRAASTTSKRQKPSHPPSNDIFIPPSGTNVFRTDLPAHRRSTWTSYVFPKRSADPTKPSSESTATTPSLASEHGFDSSSPAKQHLEHASDSHGDALLLPERTLNRKEILPSSPLLHHRVKPSNEAAAQDWRYDSIAIESIDMSLQQTSGTGHKGNTGSQSMKSAGQTGLHTKAVYLPSDPTTTELGWGVVHLYRDTEESSRLADETTKRRSLDQGKSGNISGSGSEAGFELEDCNTLCILAVPSWMMPSDLLGFVGDQAREDVSHFRLVRTGRANKYMVLMKFRSAKKAREWQKAYNGRLFSAAEPENCHVVFIKSVEFLSPDSASSETGDAAGSFPRNNQHDPFTPGSSYMSGPSRALNSKPLAPPPPNLLELPTCPVCLERMDETTGLLTILCQHVFHCACLEKWRFPGSGCPVCRYTQSPSYTFPYPRPQDSSNEQQDDDSEPVCSVCAADVNLWICLICGNIGCGRYDSAHAFAHYEATSHCYAMDIDTQRVWDYAGDGYVHRLIQSKPFSSSGSHQTSSDPAAAATAMAKQSSMTADPADHDRHANEAFRTEPPETVPREKMESMANEYTYLLTSQLEGQRRYFEEQVERAADKASQASARAEEASASAATALATAQQREEEYGSLKESLARVEKALEKSEKARSKFEGLAREFGTKLREEKSMNEGLLARVKKADEQVSLAEEGLKGKQLEVEELKELNRDLSMFIEAREKVEELQAQGEEVESGSLSLPEQQQQQKGGGKKGKGKKK